MKLISWKFSDLRSTDLAIGEHVLIARGQWEGLMFSIEGLSLSKAEREIFETKFLEIRNVVTFYIGRILISFDKRGIYDHLSNVKIVKEVPLKTALFQRGQEIVQSVRNWYFNWQNRRQFKTIHQFTIYRSWEGYFSFKADMLSAFQLASNYEADLYVKGGGLIYSPLGFEYEENREQVALYLGKRFLTKDGYELHGYKDPWCSEIQDYKSIDE